MAMPTAPEYSRARLQRSFQRLGMVGGFTTFGAIALALGFVVMPVVRRLRPRDAPTDLLTQRAMHHGARFILRNAPYCGVLELRAIDAERLSRRPQLVVANHPSLFDILLLCGLMPQADCVVNGERADHPFLRRLAEEAGFVRNDGGAAVVNECARRIRLGRSLIVFPEGTRSPSGVLGPFQRGAARIALAADCDLTPVVIEYDRMIVGKDQKWTDVPGPVVRIRLRVLPPVSSRGAAAAVEGGVPRSIAARQLTAELREAIAKPLEIDAGPPLTEQVFRWGQRQV